MNKKYKIILMLLIVIIAISSYFIIKEFVENKKETDIYEVIKIFRIITIKSKPLRLEIRYLKNEISNLKEINKELDYKLNYLIEKLKG